MLETYLKTVYQFLVRKRYTAAEAQRLCSKKAIRSAFQNIERGQRLFRQSSTSSSSITSSRLLANDFT